MVCIYIYKGNFKSSWEMESKTVCLGARSFEINTYEGIKKNSWKVCIMKTLCMIFINSGTKKIYLLIPFFSSLKLACADVYREGKKENRWSVSEEFHLNAEK